MDGWSGMMVMMLVRSAEMRVGCWAMTKKMSAVLELAEMTLTGCSSKGVESLRLGDVMYTGP